MQKTLTTLAGFFPFWLLQPVAPLHAEPTNEADDTAALLVYRVQESDYDTYFSRVLVTKDHVRLDEGDDEGPYTLFDRNEGVFYNVDPEEQSVVIIRPPSIDSANPGDSPKLTMEPVSVEEISPDADASRAEGWRLVADGELCSETVVLPGEMTETMDALAEFHDRLAGYHGAVLTVIADHRQQGPCDLADMVFAPRRPYELGLPVFFRSERMERKLVDRDSAYGVSAHLLSVPEDYRSMELAVSGR